MRNEFEILAEQALDRLREARRWREEAKRLEGEVLRGSDRRDREREGDEGGGFYLLRLVLEQVWKHQARGKDQWEPSDVVMAELTITRDEKANFPRPYFLLTLIGPGEDLVGTWALRQECRFEDIENFLTTLETNLGVTVEDLEHLAELMARGRADGEVVSSVAVDKT